MLVSMEQGLGVRGQYLVAWLQINHVSSLYFTFKNSTIKTWYMIKQKWFPSLKQNIKVTVPMGFSIFTGYFESSWLTSCASSTYKSSLSWVCGHRPDFWETVLLIKFSQHRVWECTPFIPTLGGRVKDPWEFKTSLIYTVISRPARAV